MLKTLFSAPLSANQKANRRIMFFIILVCVIMLLGVFGVYPTNSIEILRPLNGLLSWFAIFCVGFCLLNLFNKESVPGEKEFDNFSYFSLLFSLGMGIGIMVFGFNEAPSLSQYSDVKNPIALVLDHWTLIPWSMYVTFTIFEIYDAKYNILPSWLRMIKSYLYGIVMLIGITTSFCLGTIQISGAIMTIYGVDVPSYALVVLLGSLVTISLLRGLHKGMKVFAKISMYLLYAFIIVLAIVAPIDTFQELVKGIRDLFTQFFYNNIYRGADVQNDWTCFYWSWWLSWCCFCAPFITTISKGRSIRSIVFYTIIIPSILIILYMTLGNNYGMHLMKSGVEVSMIPFKAISVHWILPVFFVLLMGMFYITSSDSQSFAMDQVISKGSKAPILYRKILWVFLEVLFTTILLLAGSGTTSAIQGLSFLASPFMILFAIICLILLVKNYKKFSFN